MNIIITIFVIIYKNMKTRVEQLQFRCSHVYKLRYVIHIHLRLQAAIFDFPPTLMSDRVRISSIILHDPKNIDLYSFVFSVETAARKYTRLDSETNKTT